VRNRVYLVTCSVALLLAVTSCAYYNTFYKARSYYDKATPGVPYVVGKPDPATVQYFTKSIDYSKKVISDYPKSKWVDDAYLLWAKALIGREDPTQTMNMLSEFPARYPKSGLQAQALFYLGVGGRKSRKYPEALTALDEFLRKYPKNDLAPYAYLEQARVLSAMGRNPEAADAVTKLLDRFPRYKGRDLAQSMRADALLASGDTQRARADYHALGSRAESDEERFTYLLKEADCLEAARQYEPEMALLKEALAHEAQPQLAPGTTTPTQTTINQLPGQPPPPPVGPVYQPPTPSTERWGRLMLRIGTVHLLAGRKDDALDAYRRVSTPFSQHVLGTEAQYRVGLVYETAADDFEAARAEYGKVARAGGSSPYAVQAAQRLTNLERLNQLRAGGGDSLSKQAEAGFMQAELYLFQNNKPERSLEEYSKVAQQFAGTSWAGKALNAQAWVLRNKLDRAREADSLLWVVVREYPRTEAQLNARDYLEAVGAVVPDSMIHPPEVIAPPDTGQALTPPPTGLDSLGIRRATMRLDSLRTLFRGEPVPAPPPYIGPPAPMTGVHVPADSTRSHVPLGSPTDSTSKIPPLTAPPDTSRIKPR
jgi:tetratricopeptide (TPR) repeat protein